MRACKPGEVLNSWDRVSVTLLKPRWLLKSHFAKQPQPTCYEFGSTEPTRKNLTKPLYERHYSSLIGIDF
jgi:hypothetical protein